MASAEPRLALLACAALLAGCVHMPRSLQDPLTAEEHMRLGASYEDQGLRSKSEKEYAAALRRQKDYIPALIALGNLSFEDGNLVDAEIYYRKVLDLDPEHPSANNNLAVVYLTRGSRIDTAEQLAQRALKRAGSLKPYVLDTLAHIYMREAKPALAKAALDEADAATPRDSAFLRRRLAQSRQQLENLR